MISLDSAYHREFRGLSPLAWSMKQWWKHTKPAPWDRINGPDTFGQVLVYANHGNWQVSCPSYGCEGGMLASRVDPRFVCIECGTGPLEEVWPADVERIEAALDVRPTANRHWTPDEPVDELEHETAVWAASRFMAGV